MNITNLLSLAVGAILVENFVLVRFLGICPFLGVSKKINTALGMGIAVTCIMGLSSMLTYMLHTFVLTPLRLEYLQTLAFILIIASLVQFLELFLQKVMRSLHSALGIYLPLITTNCAVLGVTLIGISQQLSFLETLVFSVSAGIGFTLAIVLFASIRERLDYADYPAAFEGFPIALISAALLSLAFTGFSGMKIW